MSLTREDQDLQVAIAMAYAADGDPWRMIEHLQRANILAGIKVSFRRRWPGLPEEEVDDMIAFAVEKLYEKAESGEAVSNPVGYILEVMRHEACDYIAERRNIVPLDTSRDLADLAPRGRMSPSRSAAALGLARSLLPRLGEANLQAVMEHIFLAVEEGRGTLATRELAEATGLSEDAVRQCRSRGFRRLERIVREEGLMPDPAIETSPDANHSTYMRTIHERRA